LQRCEGFFFLGIKLFLTPKDVAVIHNYLASDENRTAHWGVSIHCDGNKVLAQLQNEHASCTRTAMSPDVAIDFAHRLIAQARAIKEKQHG
jgi:hypothetical protein